MTSPAAFTPEAIRDWIRSECARAGVAPTKLAKAAGLAPSTINRFLRGNGPNLNISARTIDAIGRAADSLAAAPADAGRDAA